MKLPWSVWILLGGLALVSALAGWAMCEQWLLERAERRRRARGLSPHWRPTVPHGADEPYTGP